MVNRIETIIYTIITSAREPVYVILGGFIIQPDHSRFVLSAQDKTLNLREHVCHKDKTMKKCIVQQQLQKLKRIIHFTQIQHSLREKGTSD